MTERNENSPMSGFQWLVLGGLVVGSFCILPAIRDAALGDEFPRYISADPGDWDKGVRCGKPTTIHLDAPREITTRIEDSHDIPLDGPNGEVVRITNASTVASERQGSAAQFTLARVATTASLDANRQPKRLATLQSVGEEAWIDGSGDDFDLVVRLTQYDSQSNGALTAQKYCSR